MYHLWFRRLRPGDWFGGGKRVDDLLRQRFAGDLDMLAQARAASFLDGPKTALAAVLLFDQVPRNLYRETPRAFLYDPLARTIVHGALHRGWDRALAPRERQFLYMPLMHSEDIADQELSLALFRRLPRGYGWQFAREHHRMIARFGRFPHRNEVLGRNSTAAEKRAVAAGFSW